LAITKILYINECGKHDPGKHLRQSIKYILVPEKTGKSLYVSAVNCQVSGAYEQMKNTKVQFGKTEGRQGYHIILSFEEGEVDAPRAFEIVGKFVNEYLGDEYQAVYAVHDNTDHIHGHIIFNSVNFITGRKYRYKKGDWAKYMQPITNRLCEEYGMSTITIDKDETAPSENYTEWRDSRDGKFVWSDMIKRDLDACILQAADFDEFVSLLQGKGYEVKQNKYFAIKPPGLARFRRCYRLGENYSEERIRERIAAEDINRYRENHSEARIIKVLMPYRIKRAKLTGVQRKYFAKLYRIGKLKQRPYSQAYKYRDEIRKMHRLHDQYIFLADNEIHSEADLLKVYEALKEEKEQLSKERSRFYKEKSRYTRLWKLADRMHELEPAERTFKGGDTFFNAEHEEYERLLAEIKKEGYSLSELEEVRSYYDGKEVAHQDMQKECNKKIRIAESLIKEIKDDKDRNGSVPRPEIKRQPTKRTV
jgi:hypothetical protein